MTKDPDSAECPMCGRSLPSDATSCSGCGADLSMSSLEELEKVAKSLSSGGPMPGKEVPKEKAEPRPAPEERKKESIAGPEAPKHKPEEGTRENRIGKFFGKRKK